MKKVEVNTAGCGGMRPSLRSRSNDARPLAPRQRQTTDRSRREEHPQSGGECGLLGTTQPFRPAAGFADTEKAPTCPSKGQCAEGRPDVIASAAVSRMAVLLRGGCAQLRHAVGKFLEILRKRLTVVDQADVAGQGAEFLFGLNFEAVRARVEAEALTRALLGRPMAQEGVHRIGLERQVFDVDAALMQALVLAAEPSSPVAPGVTSRRKADELPIGYGVVERRLGAGQGGG